jgi:hypothetical protein
MSGESDPTPLQHKLDILADKIGKFGKWIAILIFVAMTVHLSIERLMYPE